MGLPGAQICSPIDEIGISTLQVEHLMVGKKLDARVGDAMIGFHVFSAKFYVEECGLGRSMQLFVYVLRA